VTLNVKGLADPERRRWFFYMLRTLSAHVICLQEVHADPAQASFWTQEWGGAASWNQHTAILLSPSLGSATFDDRLDGRVLSSTFRYQGRTFSLTNLYAPASRTARSQFFDLLSEQSLYYSSFDFLVGDWNTYPDPTQDRSSTSPLILITHGHIFDHVFYPFLMPHSLELQNTFSLSTTRVSICMLVLTMFLLIPTILTSTWTLE